MFKTPYGPSYNHPKENTMNEHHLTQQEKPATVSTPTVESTLKERGSRYGRFANGADVMQQLKTVIYNQLGRRDKRLPPYQQEALDMICHKIGRIINGDNDLADSWHDIAGYAQLVDDILNGKNP